MPWYGCDGVARKEQGPTLMQNSLYIDGKTFDQSPIFLMSICMIS